MQKIKRETVIRLGKIVLVIGILVTAIVIIRNIIKKRKEEKIA